VIRATLITDGSSDRVLVPILEWIVAALTPTPLSIQWGDLRVVRRPLGSLRERVLAAIQLYPCELLFVHRDAEAQPADRRYQEVAGAVQEDHLHVAVVPVRMQEAWLLHDETALRRAVGRPGGREPLSLPAITRLESLAAPKRVLYDAFVAAASVSGRRRNRFDPGKTAHRLATLIEDWSPLRRLPAFQRLERDTRHALQRIGVPLR
jgi:hypothetical protein